MHSLRFYFYYYASMFYAEKDKFRILQSKIKVLHLYKYLLERDTSIIFTVII